MGRRHGHSQHIYWHRCGLRRQKRGSPFFARRSGLVRERCLALLDRGCCRDTARPVWDFLAAPQAARAQPISECPTCQWTADRLVKGLPGRNGMPERIWQREVEENLQDFERRQASLLHNPRLARLYIERGVAVAVVVVLTSFGSTLRALGENGRKLLLASTIFGGMVAIALVSIGLI